MMSGHLTEQEIELYGRREMDPAERRETDFHLATCETCRKRVLDSEYSVVAFNVLSEAFLPSIDEAPFHLSSAELKSYNSGAAAKADQIICESHIEICARCSEELRSLSALPVTEALKAKGRSLEWRFGRSWQGWQAFTPARAAVAIALLGFLVFAIVLWRQRTISTRNESALTNSPETPLTSVSPGSANETTPNPAEQVKSSDQTMLAGLKDNDREIRLDREGNLTGLEGFDESAQRMARAVLAGEGLARPTVLDNISSSPIKLLGEPPSENVFQLISPLGRVISEQHPTLRWQSLSGATSYSVSVFDENFNRLAQSPTLSQPAWTVAFPLQRGRIYSWEVTAVKDGKEITAPVAPASRAQFRILEAEQLNALTKMKGQKPMSHLALGLTYARFGLLGEAEREFRQLVRENPDSTLAKKLLRTVQTWQVR